MDTAATVDRPVADAMAEVAAAGEHLAAREDDAGLRAAAEANGVPFTVVDRTARAGFPVPDPADPPPGAARVVVTGCYDWLHSGHIRFFMDAAAYGALYAVVGSDRNVRLLKGPGHPLQHEDERRYMVGAAQERPSLPRVVGQGLDGCRARDRLDWPTHYVVNEDGDQPEKRDFCEKRGIEYVVLKRVPHAGLPARTSTALRGF